MYLIITREDFKVYGICDNYASVKKQIDADPNIEEKDLIISKELEMRVVSRVINVDGKCVYKNKDFWSQDFTVLTDFLEHYDEHTVTDIFGEPIDKSRFELEWYNNRDALARIDGLAGEVEYNITVGNEFISLFREECVKTDFKTITPLEIATKLAPIISLVQTGSFRETKQVLQTIENDDFLTPERIQKYIAMMDSADVIEYATPEEFFYTAQENT